jgi:hypothetical protein
MLNGIEENIEYFFNALKKVKENADKINPDNLRYPIYFILLDVLARYAFPNEEGSGECFVKLIDSYSNWKYRNYISILLLNDLLKIEKRKKCFKENKEFNDLEEKVNKVRNNWGPEWSHRILNPEEADLSIEEDKDFKNFEKSRYWELIKKCSYSSCIYQMRNGLIHSFLFPGSPDWINDPNRTNPYYSISENSYGLSIPTGVIPILVENCLSNLKGKTMKEINKCDPYDIFTSEWFSKLKKKKKCF